ncbi:hypothetical protein AJ85_17055 [Alkalihalobacillus alcalophilus ATCC 27647 = CGMCC 1.3604]|uniref:Uncharacterized protein n=1 Tax=Alkalihalobacillus alcalophilus ATCC 27647 = CGMCC 1.3604 TaxID=1218173 RepID=A0A094WK86_ALKAL|nr:hypothetical protein [Alkalihalobacillus alcalophilus]KGA97231.1 hypothetical protein BALCAV_0211535 [Alkalihalobacillus alcalophilus ATCC 27647 = CGMCC 1.3604]MED1561526.1 hypothetical protein [Alkalihalobacillus alcalophilus]THG89535.1 hypothetical protein AJ85_17055 [Alkalihalobacillus alcalophilus ATCC 27647 = CGMCC 1.3604]
MRIIQTINDLEWLKAEKVAPNELVAVIEQDFLTLYEATGRDDELVAFRLPSQEAIILLEKGDNVLAWLDPDSMDLEYVEKHKHGGIEFYRIARRIEHEFQLIYTLVGIHSEDTEQFFQEHAEWNEGLGDFHV